MYILVRTFTKSDMENLASNTPKLKIIIINNSVGGDGNSFSMMDGTV